jgi:hypothetical protein
MILFSFPYPLIQYPPSKDPSSLLRLKRPLEQAQPSMAKMLKVGNKLQGPE